MEKNGVLKAYYSRREVLKILGFGSLALMLPACNSLDREAYIRPEGLYPLGDLMNLLYEKQHIRDQAILVFLDEGGWSSMSARCSYEGCDLTYQSDTFLCACCRSVYDHYGAVLKGPATHDLPYYEMTFKNDQLQADTSKIVPKSHRFMKPEIKDLVQELRRKVLEEGRGSVKIPRVLTGKGSEDNGVFRLESEDSAYEAEMDRWERTQK